MIDEPERGKLQWRMIDCVTNIGHVSSVPVGHGLFSFSFVCRPGVVAAAVVFGESEGVAGSVGWSGSCPVW